MAPREKRTREKRYEIIAVKPWEDDGAVSAAKIIPGKRQRTAVKYSK